MLKLNATLIIASTIYVLGQTRLRSPWKCEVFIYTCIINKLFECDLQCKELNLSCKANQSMHFQPACSAK